MEMFYTLMGLALGLFLLLAQIFAWIAFFQLGGLKRRIARLESELILREVRAARAEAPTQRPDDTGQPELPFGRPPEAAPAPARVPQVRKTAEAAPPAAAPPPEVDEAGEAPPRSQEAKSEPWAAPPPPPAAPPTRSQAEGVEQAITSRWMIWLGAVAVGLSAVFLFSYAIEQGWLGPTTRVVMGLILGTALIAGGEWTHRRPIEGLAPDYVPQALTASGVFALYASVYAAHGLYALIAIPVAFVALGAVSFAGLILAVRQGWFVALLGLAGGYAMPALLERAGPQAIPVFTYLFVLTVGCLAVMRFRIWPFMAVATLAGCLGWPLLWLIGPWSLGDQGALSLYALGVAAVFALLSVGFPVKRPDTPATAWLAGMIADTSGMGFVAQGGVLVLLAVACDYNSAAFVFLGLYAALGFGFGLRRAAYESLGVASALIVAAAFLLWPQPAELTIPAEIARHGVENWGDTFGPIVMPEEFRIFFRAALGFAVLYGLGGFLALGRVATPPVWAWISATMPLYLLTLAYWRIGGFELNVEWAAVAAGLSLAELGAASALGRVLPEERRTVPLGFYAAATTAALALAFTCVLREAWLTVALSVELLALSWIWSRLKVDEIRLIAWLVAAVVIIRLVVNYRIIDYEGSVAGLFSWVIYGYGLPAAAFFGASRLFGQGRRDPLVALCEAGAAGFGFLMVALQLRVWTSGTIYWAGYGLFDMAVQSVWWLIAAGLLLRREVTARSEVARWGGWALLAIAALQIGFGHLFWNNPLFIAERVGEWPFVNLLGLAYLAPALLCLGLAAGKGFDLPEQARKALWIAAGVLVFTYLTLEVRRSFQGGQMWVFFDKPTTNGEFYAYSAVWIVYALALLAVGILRDSVALRYASLSVLSIAVAKVFLYDMSDLTGLYRVASFLGLGLTLIGIGYIYRRFVFRPQPAPEEG
jgi:uncharacterized membrane protein